MQSLAPRVLSAAAVLVLLTAACGGPGDGEAPGGEAPGNTSGHETAPTPDMPEDGTPVATTVTLEVSGDEATMAAGTGHDMGDDGMDSSGDMDSDDGSDDGSGDGSGSQTSATAGHHASADSPTQYDADVADAVQTISVEVAGGAPVGGHQRVEVDLGSVVALVVTADAAEEVHVHGYDILRAASDGHPAQFAFTAEIPGVFEVELEGSGRLLLLLEIS